MHPWFPWHSVRVEASRPSSRVVHQRIRNRLIDYLKLASSYADQQDYAAAVPHVNVPYEIINQWQDWVPSGGFVDGGPPGVFSEQESEALRAFGSVWDEVADEVPDSYPSIEQMQALDSWQRLREAAAEALQVLEVRGQLSEHEEVQP